MNQMAEDDQTIIGKAIHIHEKIEAIKVLRKKISALMYADETLEIIDLPSVPDMEELEKYGNASLKFFDGLQASIHSYKVIPCSMFIVLKNYIQSSYCT